MKSIKPINLLYQIIINMKTSNQKIKTVNKVGGPIRNFSTTNSIVWNSRRRYRL